MNTSLINRIGRAYGLDIVTTDPPQKGYRNQSTRLELRTGESVNLMLYKREPAMLARIQRANLISAAAAGAGLPARALHDPRLLRLSNPAQTQFAALYNYLPGHTIPWEAYTRAHLKLLGAELSRLHAGLKAMVLPPDLALPLVETEYEHQLNRMQHYFTHPSVAPAIERKLGLSLNPRTLQHYRIILQATRGLPQRQPLHLDFVRGNILFAGTGPDLHISGILDFEKTATGHPVFDLARTLAFTIVDCKYKTESQVRKYLLQSGYNKRGPVRYQRLILPTTTGPLNLLEALIDLFLLYDYFKFLRHNPYDFLHSNEHYVRTRDLLIRRGLIHQITLQPDAPNR